MKLYELPRKIFSRGWQYLFLPLNYIKKHRFKKKISVPDISEFEYYKRSARGDLDFSSVTFSNEESPDIKHLFFIYRMRQLGIRVNLDSRRQKIPLPGVTWQKEKKNLSWDIPARKNSWNCIHFEDVKKYRGFYLSLFVSVDTVFSEVQFAFNYRSIDSRLRFNIVDNRKVTFDVIHGGMFQNIAEKRFSFRKGKEYFVEIVFCDGCAFFAVDNKVLMSVKVTDDEFLLNRGELVMICWNMLDNSSIRARYREVNLKSI